MTTNRYVLDESGNPKMEPDLIAWAQWYEKANRHVAADTVLVNGVTPVKVSTVFLGLDHNFCLGGPPVLWETMIFGGEHDQYQERYQTREQAERGHRRAVALVKGMVSMQGDWVQ